MKEKKRPFRHPTQITTKTLTDVLGVVLKGISSSYNNYFESFVKEWPQLLGQQYASMTQVMGYKQGILTIKVNNSSLYAVLHHHKKEEILAQIRKRYPKWYVKNIIFRMH